MRTTCILVNVVILFSAGALVRAQGLALDLNAELTGALYGSSSPSGRKINSNFREDDPFNALRGKLFPHVVIGRASGVEGEFLFDNKAVSFDHTRTQRLRLDGLYAFVHGLYEDRLNVWLGRIPTPVGTFSRRSYSHLNPLVGYPLAYHYKVPYDAFELSAQRKNLDLRDNGDGAATSIYEACWITGLSLFGTVAGVDYLIAAGRGTLTNPEAAANHGFQIAGHVGRAVSSVVRIGASFGIAPYLQYDRGLPSGVSVRDPKHRLYGFDVECKLDAIHIYGEAIHNIWDTPQYSTEKSISAFSWYVEGQYVFTSQIYAAARFDQMIFSHITDPEAGGRTPWGYNVGRIEAGMGFHASKHLILKGVVQYNRIDYPAARNITIIALQSALRIEDMLSVGSP